MSRLSANTKKQRVNRHPDQRGIILVVTLMVVLILALLGLAFLTISGTEHQIAKNDQEIAQALYVAEGGLQTAINQLNRGLLPPAAIDGIGPGEFTVTVTDASPPAGQQRIEATGYVPTQASPRAVKRIAVLVCNAAWAAINRCSSPFQDALFGLNSVTVSASTTDSYDCANGGYGGSNVGSNGDVGSNGNITLSGSTQVHGDAITTAGHTVSNPALVIPPGMVKTEAPVTMPDVACPAGGFTPSVPSLGSHSSYNPATGDLKIQGGDNLTLSSPATYYFHNVTISPGSLTIATGGHVDIYIGGKLDAGGGSVVNSSSLPTNLTILGCGADTSAWTFSSGNGNAYLGLYAPNHSLTLSGGGNLYGSFIAEGTITESGGTRVHYDECLGREPLNGKFAITPGSWTELAL